MMNEQIFNDWLERQKVQDQVNAVLHGADDGELYLQSTRMEKFEFSDHELKSASITKRQGFGLRTVCGELVGYSHANRLDDEALARAADAVKLAKRGQEGHWDVSPERTNRHLYSAESPFDSIPITTKIDTLKAIDAYARGKDRRVKQVSASLSGEQSLIGILRAGGERYTDIRPQVEFKVNVVMAENDRMEPGRASLAGRFSLEELLDESVWKAQVDEAIRIAEVNLTSVSAPAGKMTVVLDAGWPGVMIHEAVGHGLEGDSIRKGQSIYAGHVGEQVAAKGVTIVDNGTFGARRGSLTIDDEGTPSQENVLIEDGILKGFMHDRLSARLMGVKPTGNGRREDYSHPVMPRMTNTYMTGGKHDCDEILSSVEDGVFAVKLGGGQVNTTSGDFVFECTEAYRVRKGQIEEPIKGATIIGNGPESMKNVTMIGKEYKLDKGSGVCGKAGQSVPVCVGQPMVRMENITVGGTG